MFEYIFGYLIGTANYITTFYAMPAIIQLLLLPINILLALFAEILLIPIVFLSPALLIAGFGIWIYADM